MRQTQSESQSSWSHYAKAAAVFTLNHGNLFNRPHHRFGCRGG